MPNAAPDSRIGADSAPVWSVALIQTPHRFRSKRQLWTYSGLGLRRATVRNTAMCVDNCSARKKPQQVRGLNDPATLCCTSITL